MTKFRNSILLITLSMFLGCVASDEDYQPPLGTIKESGYRVLYRPQYTVGNARNLEMWLDDIEKQGWELIDFNNNSGDYIFHKRKVGGQQ